MTTVTGLFDNYYDAKFAVEQLEDAGIPSDDITIISRTRDGRRVEAQDDNTAEGAAAGAGVGAVAGGTGGLLAGLGIVAIPGVGPVVAAGWLIATLVGAAGGAVVGGAAGGIVGALTRSGISEDDANVYAEGVRRGGSLVIARVAGDRVAVANEILDRIPRIDIPDRRAFYDEQGWKRFDERLGPYMPSDDDPIHYAPAPRV